MSTSYRFFEVFIMDDLHVIRAIERYIDECLDYPKELKKDNLFKVFCYSEWAAEEILNRVMDEASKLPYHITGREPISHIEIIRDFIYEMDYYYNECHTKENKLIFNTARSTGIEILYLFL